MELQDNKVHSFIMPRRKLSKLLGVSPSTAWRKIQKLRKDKSINWYYCHGLPNIYRRKK